MESQGPEVTWCHRSSICINVSGYGLDEAWDWLGHLCLVSSIQALMRGAPIGGDLMGRALISRWNPRQSLVQRHGSWWRRWKQKCYMSLSTASQHTEWPSWYQEHAADLSQLRCLPCYFGSTSKLPTQVPALMVWRILLADTIIKPHWLLCHGFIRGFCYPPPQGNSRTFAAFAV